MNPKSGTGGQKGSTKVWKRKRLTGKLLYKVKQRQERERWKGCCHGSAVSPNNPSSLHMIISEATNEPPLHIWNTNNITLNTQWQARLVTGRDLKLAATEHRQRLILTESLSHSLSGANHLGQNQKLPSSVNTGNVEATETQRISFSNLRQISVY